jgi:hypothetical protein
MLVSLVDQKKKKKTTASQLGCNIIFSQTSSWTLKRIKQTNFQKVSPEETMITLGSGDFCSSLTSPKHL